MTCRAFAAAGSEDLVLDSGTRRVLNPSADFRNVALTLGNFTMSDSVSARIITLGTMNGTKFGATTNDKLSFYGAAPVIRPSGSVLDALTSLNLVGSPTINFSELSAKPTTLAGYGVTDGQPLDSDLTAIAALSTTSYGRSLLTAADSPALLTLAGAASSAHTHTFSSLTSKPTTLSGFGITDAQPLDGDLSAIAALSTTSYGRGVLALTDGAALLTYAGAQPLDGDLTSIAALATTSFGRSVLTMANSGALLTLAGGQPLDSDLTAIAALSTTSFGRGVLALADGPATVSYIGAQPLDSDLTAVAALSTTSYGRGVLALADGPALLSYAAAAAASHTHTFSSLTSKPTTLSGFGITDGQPLDSDLTAIAALTTTSFGRSVLAQTNAITERTYLGVANGDGLFDAKSYGAKGDDSTDDAPLINAALTAGSGKTVRLPAGTYKIAGDILIPATTVLEGDEFQMTTLHVTTSASLTNGVLVMQGQGATVRHLAIVFDQADTALAGSLTHYKPAIYAQDRGGWYLEHVAIIRAWDGIDMRGNAGQSVLSDVNMSAFNIGVNIDGALDVVRVNNFHFWPFDLTANQRVVFFAASQSIGIKAGRIDGLYLTNSLFINGTGVSFYNSSASGFGATYYSPGGPPWGFLTNVDFDTQARFLMSDGDVQAANCSFTSGDASATLLNLSGGLLKVSNSKFHAPLGASISATNGSLMLANCVLDQANQDTSIVGFNPASGGSSLSVTNCIFTRTAANYSNATIAIGTNARATVSNNRANDLGGFTANFVSVATDNYHVITNNAAPGWLITLPGGAAITQSFGNNTGGTNQNGPLLAGTVTANNLIAVNSFNSGAVYSPTFSTNTTNASIAVQGNGNGGVAIGSGGTPIKKIGSTSVTFTVGILAAGASSTAGPFGSTGALAGDRIEVVEPTDATSYGSVALRGFVDGSNNVYVVATNIGNSASASTGSRSWRIIFTRF